MADAAPETDSVPDSSWRACRFHVSPLEGFIQLEVRKVGNRAAARFGGDRITGLVRLVDCDGCDLREREMAVWATGELKDRRALPVLKAHFGGRACDHNRDLCQYELRKAIMKIDGMWGWFGHDNAAALSEVVRP